MRILLGALLLAQGFRAICLYPPAANEAFLSASGSLNSQDAHVIRGQVLFPHQLKPEGAVLTVRKVPDDIPHTVTVSRDGSVRGGGINPVTLEADGSFVTPGFRSGTYVLSVVRAPHSDAERVLGLGIVAVGSRDVSGVTIAVRRDTALTGRFRMESDNPKAEWPTSIVCGAPLALDGMPLLPDVSFVEGAPGGRFVVRNAFGPRVLRCGYTTAEGNPWWPSRVMLNGVDVTNVPTDFSAHEGAELEVVFTQHPARIEGTVTDDQGQAVRAPWILVSAADGTLRHQWPTASNATQGDATGRFSIAVPSGTYLVSAVRQGSFNSWREAHQGVLRFTSGEVAIQVKEREKKAVKLIVREP